MALVSEPGGVPVEPCPACGNPIVWAIDTSAKWTPVDAEVHREGTLTLAAGWDGRPVTRKPLAKLAFGRQDLHRPHTGTCTRPRVLKEIGR